MWVLKPFRIGPLLVAALTAGAAAALVAGTAVPFPSLAAAGLGQVPLLALVALLPVAALVVSWRSWPAPMLATTVRPWPVHVALAVVAASSVPAAVALAAGARPDIALAVGRDVLGCAGLALLTWRFAGRDPAVAAAPVCLVACAVAGTPSDGLSWAFLLQDGLVAGSWPVPVALAIAGVAASASLAAADVRRADVAAGG